MSHQSTKESILAGSPCRALPHRQSWPPVPETRTCLKYLRRSEASMHLCNTVRSYIQARVDTGQQPSWASAVACPLCVWSAVESGIAWDTVAALPMPTIAAQVVAKVIECANVRERARVQEHDKNLKSDMFSDEAPAGPRSPRAVRAAPLLAAAPTPRCAPRWLPATPPAPRPTQLPVAPLPALPPALLLLRRGRIGLDRLAPSTSLCDTRQSACALVSPSTILPR